MEIFGHLSPGSGSAEKKQWNAYFRDHAIDAYFDAYKTYPAPHKNDLRMRLSEMFLHDRRAYTIDESLRKEIVSLMDRLDVSVSDHVDVVVNEKGILVGYCSVPFEKLITN